MVGIVGDALVEAAQRGEAGRRGAFGAGRVVIFPCLAQLGVRRILFLHWRERHDGGSATLGIRRAGIRAGDDIGQGVDGGDVILPENRQLLGQSLGMSRRHDDRQLAAAQQA